MNSNRAKQAALQDIQKILEGLTKVEALQVIRQLLCESIGEVDAAKTLPKPTKASRVTRGRLSKIQMDAELEAFILSHLNNASQKALLDLCLDQFGQARAPSRSALSRYLTELSTQNKEKKHA